MSMLEVVQVVEPIRRITACPLGLSEHDCGLCPLHRRLDDVAAAAQRILGGTTLQNLLEDERRPLGRLRVEQLFACLECKDSPQN